MRTDPSSDPILAQLQKIRSNLSSSGSSTNDPPSSQGGNVTTSGSSKNGLIAPASPTKDRKRTSISQAARKGVEELKRQRQDALKFATMRANALASSANSASEQAEQAPSSFLDRAAAAQRRKSELHAQQEAVRKERQAAEAREQSRSAGFDQAAKAIPRGLKRDERLALVENIQVGPKDLPPNKQDPDWMQMEPYSGTTLRNRELAHEDLTEHLRGRYHLPPSLLYSVVRPFDGPSSAETKGRDGDYDVPVDGDWLTIAVIAEKSEIRFTKPKPWLSGEQDEMLHFKKAGRGSDGKLNLELDADTRRKATKADEEEMERAMVERRQAGRSRKYIMVKLVDLNVESEARGDNMLNMMCIEADEIDQLNNGIEARPEIHAQLEELRRSKRRYINGSQGAFELIHHLPEGTLIAILNPRILKPYSPDGSRAKSNLLTLTPRSAHDVLTIGRAQHYAHCQAIRRDGTRCTAFVDRRTLSAPNSRGQQPIVCEFHLTQAVTNVRRGRADLANASTGFGAAPPGYDNDRPSSGMSSGHPRGRRSGRRRQGSGRHSEDGDEEEDDWERGPYHQKTTAHTMGDGLDANTGRTFYVEGSEAAVKASDPASFKFNVTQRLGRGKTEKDARLKRQLEAEEFARKVKERFGDPVRSAQVDEARKRRIEEEAEGKDPFASSNGLIDPTSSAAKLLQDAQKTIDERKKKAQLQRREDAERRRKLLGIKPTDVDEHDSRKRKSALDPLTSDEEPDSLPVPEPEPSQPAKKRFVYSAEAIKRMGFDPLAGRATGLSQVPANERTARSALLERASNAPSIRSQRDPDLRMQRKHRPGVMTGQPALPKPARDYSDPLEFGSDSDVDIPMPALRKTVPNKLMPLKRIDGAHLPPSESDSDDELEIV